MMNENTQMKSSFARNIRKVNFKHLIFTFVFSALCIAITFWVTQKYYENKWSKYEQLADLQEGNIEQKVALLDVSIGKINSLLAEKGIEPLTASPSSGNMTLSPTEALAFYGNKLQNLESELDALPFGTPHEGGISSEFGGRNNPFSGQGHENHPGIDFKGNIGDPILATATGTVVFAGQKGGYGNCVIVEHKRGIKTLYAHLNKVSVRPNQKVQTGTQVGELGNTGRSTGPHIHYEVMEHDQKVNPRKYMNNRPSNKL